TKQHDVVGLELHLVELDAYPAFRPADDVGDDVAELLLNGARLVGRVRRLLEELLGNRMILREPMDAAAAENGASAITPMRDQQIRAHAACERERRSHPLEVRVTRGRLADACVRALKGFAELLEQLPFRGFEVEQPAERVDEKVLDRSDGEEAR